MIQTNVINIDFLQSIIQICAENSVEETGDEKCKSW